MTDPEAVEAVETTADDAAPESEAAEEAAVGGVAA